MLKQRVTFSLIFKIVNSLIGLISSVFVARYMGAETMGILSACLAFIAIFTIFGDFGFGIAHFRAGLRRSFDGAGAEAALGARPPAPRDAPRRHGSRQLLLAP